MKINKRFFLFLTFFCSSFIYSTNTPEEVKTKKIDIKRKEKSAVIDTVRLKIIDKKTEKAFNQMEVLFIEQFESQKVNELGEVEIPVSYLNQGKLKIALIADKVNYEEHDLDFSHSKSIILSVRVSEQEVKKLSKINIKKIQAGKTAAQRIVGQKELKKTLQVNFNDAIKTLQSQAGVSTTGSATDASLLIQGGGNTEWVAVYDNAYVVNPDRWGNAVSMFNPLVIGHIDFYVGGYPAVIDNGLSGALNVNTLRPNANKWKFEGGFDNSFEGLIHGPISKNIRLLFNLRRTWIDGFQDLFPNSTFFNSSGGQGIRRAPYIADGLLKTEFIFNPKSYLSLTVYASQEGLDLDRNEIDGQVPSPNQTEGAESRFSYREYNLITALNLYLNPNPLNSITLTAAYIPIRSRYRQYDNGFFALNTLNVFHAFQFSYQHQLNLKKNKMEFSWLSHFHPGNISYDEKRYFVNRQGLYTFTPANETWSLFYHYHSFRFANNWQPIRSLIFNYGLTANYSTLNQDFFLGPKLGLEIFTSRSLVLHFRTGLYNFHQLDQEELRNITNIKSQKSFHFIIGSKGKVGPLLMLTEGFYKYYWDVYHLDVLGKWPNKATRHAVGASIMARLPERKNQIFSGSASYTFQYARELMTEIGSTNEDVYWTSIIRRYPKINEYYTPDYLRYHTFTFIAQAKPFIKLKTKLKKRADYIFRHQSLATEFIALSSKPETAVVDVLRTTNSAGETKYGLEYGEYHNAEIPPIIRWSLRYNIAFNEKLDLFLSFVNILNWQNILALEYTIHDEYFEGGSRAGDVAYRQRYGSQAVRAVPVIDTGFTVRGGFKVRF